MKMRFDLDRTSIFVVVILYSVGLWGFLNRDASIINLTPANLCLSLLLLMIHAENGWKSWIRIALPVYALGFGIEAIGVHTGWPFGTYYYQDVFGYKWLDTPLLIGVNWVIVAFGAHSATIILLRRINLPLFLKTLFAASLMVGLDYLIEPMAISYQFWQWENDVIPMSNYISWLVVSWAMQLWISYFLRNNDNTMAAFVFLMQFIFFGVLTLWSK
jgi:bisanhydrobacterioruberin hydratase